MKIIGLTGSIAMGKSTTANMFRSSGIPVHDSDAVVHQLYRRGAVAPLAEIFPSAVVNGRVDRQVLSAIVVANPIEMSKLEAIVHPMVEAKRCEFLRESNAAGKKIIVLDIPLLFEIGATNLVDIVVVVSAEDLVQRQRALSRPNMTEEKFLAIKAKQMPDFEKRRMAHFIIETDYGIEFAKQQVRALLRALT